MPNFKLFHPALEYVEGHDSEIIFDNKQFGIIVGGHMAVCPTCQGTGTHDRTDIDCSQLVDDMHSDGDVDGLENYFSGGFSQVCVQCNGKNVVLAPNNVPEWASKAMYEWDADARSDAAYAAQERAMGA